MFVSTEAAALVLAEFGLTADEIRKFEEMQKRAREVLKKGAFGYQQDTYRRQSSTPTPALDAPKKSEPKVAIDIREIYARRRRLSQR